MVRAVWLEGERLEWEWGGWSPRDWHENNRRGHRTWKWGGETQQLSFVAVDDEQDHHCRRSGLDYDHDIDFGKGKGKGNGKVKGQGKGKGKGFGKGKGKGYWPITRHGVMEDGKNWVSRNLRSN